MDSKCLNQVQCGVRLRAVGPRALSLYPPLLAESQARSLQAYLIYLVGIIIHAKNITSMSPKSCDISIELFTIITSVRCHELEVFVENSTGKQIMIHASPYYVVYVAQTITLESVRA